MESQNLHIIYHPSIRGYSAYSRELDGMSTDAKTIEELFDKVKYLIKVRIESLKEIGRKKDVDDLQQKEIIFVEE